MKDVIKEIHNIIESLNEIDNYYESLTTRLSEIDQKTQDLLHYIEYNKISILWAYKYLVELKKLRIERRKIKNDMAILGKYSEHKNKLLSVSNRVFLLTEIHKVEKQLETPYKNRQYKDGEIEEILKKSNKDDWNFCPLLEVKTGLLPTFA